MGLYVYFKTVYPYGFFNDFMWSESKSQTLGPLDCETSRLPFIGHDAKFVISVVILIKDINSTTTCANTIA